MASPLSRYEFQDVSSVYIGVDLCQAKACEDGVSVITPFAIARITEGLSSGQICINKSDPNSGDYFLLLITQSFLKSRECLFPLLNLFVKDPISFEARLLPVKADEISIFSTGSEAEYERYWTEELGKIKDSTDTHEVQTIAKNIASFIRALKDTLMPQLKDVDLLIAAVQQKITLPTLKRSLASSQTLSGKCAKLPDVKFLDSDPFFNENFTPGKKAKLFSDASRLRDLSTSIFLSYCWTPSKESANRINTIFSGLGLKLTTDAKANFFDNIPKFLEAEIGETTYMISVLNNEYFRSSYCMFEASLMMQRSDWTDRIFPIILPKTDLSEAAITSFEGYWKSKVTELQPPATDAKSLAMAQCALKALRPYMLFASQAPSFRFPDQLPAQVQKIIELMLKTHVPEK